ncbi:hypothetical protein Ancab_019989 [Ancistrocladus abbreviatus]
MEIVSQERTGMIVGNILIGVQCTIFAVAGFSGGYGCGATPVLIKLTREFGDERWQPSWAASDMQVAAVKPCTLAWLLLRCLRSMARLHAFRGPTAEAMEASAASLTLWTLLLISLEEEREVGLLLVIFFRALRNLKANLVLSDLEFKEDEE